MCCVDHQLDHGLDVGLMKFILRSLLLCLLAVEVASSLNSVCRPGGFYDSTAFTILSCSECNTEVGATQFSWQCDVCCKEVTATPTLAGTLVTQTAVPSSLGVERVPSASTVSTADNVFTTQASNDNVTTVQHKTNKVLGVEWVVVMTLAALVGGAVVLYTVAVVIRVFRRTGTFRCLMICKRAERSTECTEHDSCQSSELTETNV